MSSIMSEFMAWKIAKTKQQIFKPLDVASQNNIGAAVIISQNSSAVSKNVSVATTPTTITVPIASGTLIVATPTGPVELLKK